MPDLRFAIERAEIVPFAAVPLLAFKLRISTDHRNALIHTVALRAQIQIEVTRRHYDGHEQVSLTDLFGEPNRWGQTLRTLLWTHVNVVIPRFKGETLADLQVACTFDFNIASTKYFHGLRAGEIPLSFQLSGSVFYQNDSAELQVAPISWDKEVSFRLPVETWKALMREYYPNSNWLAIHRDTFERLLQFKTREGIPTWEEAIERALAAAQETVRT